MIAGVESFPITARFAPRFCRSLHLYADDVLPRLYEDPGRLLQVSQRPTYVTSTECFGADLTFHAKFSARSPNHR